MYLSVHVVARVWGKVGVALVYYFAQQQCILMCMYWSELRDGGRSPGLIFRPAVVYSGVHAVA